MRVRIGQRPVTRFGATDEFTADAPPEVRGLTRDGVRLLVASEQDGAVTVEHATFRAVGRHLRSGDVLVVNNSATIPAEVDGRLASRGAVVVHLGAELDDCSWVIELRTAPDAGRPILEAAVGDEIVLAGRHRRATRSSPALRLVAPYPEAGSSPSGSGNRLWRAVESGSGGLTKHLASHGRPIAYGYLRARFPLAAYQTVFASIPGSSEMASAARPFTTELVTSLVSAGIVIVPVTLHTGLSSQEAGEAPQPERFAVSRSTAAVVNAAKAEGGRVVAVGTTATRALESAADEAGVVHAAGGWTDLVISPDRPVRVVGGLVTGWHNSDASHLLLVESVAGPTLTQAAYDAALAHHYAWHEFGDSALLLPSTVSDGPANRSSDV
ncbi:MAG TPA: S-adenosylmethionine:tRNA ribosyltransferase-isomerase [Intrasporangium sp.]|jgi:S-adenosylmethionine:tRNA-ribosyltransferase-isomerase (queuine synthetase)|uniref:S-adenosylmethionine:tRNA ribosyltransferase-isomerase n=1 Tax=Intrasporangium sp. TaxID=1925024 RepID=UPI002F947F64